MHKRCHPRDLPNLATPEPNPSQHENRNHIMPTQPAHVRHRTRSKTSR
jgi:hypothetical protein